MDFLDNLVGSAKVALHQFLDSKNEDAQNTDKPMECTTSQSTSDNARNIDVANAQIEASFFLFNRHRLHPLFFIFGFVFLMRMED